MSTMNAINLVYNHEQDEKKKLKFSNCDLKSKGMHLFYGFDNEIRLLEYV